MKISHDRKPMIDCFAYNKEKNKCNALCELVCTYKNCRFYKDRINMDTREIERAIKHYEGSINK